MIFKNKAINRSEKVVENAGTLHHSENLLFRNDELRMENILGRAIKIFRDTGFNHMIHLANSVCNNFYTVKHEGK